MDFFKKFINGDFAFAAFISSIFFEICFVVFFYFRFSDFAQDIMTVAYDQVIGDIEYHQVVAMILIFAAIGIPLGFYTILEKKIKPTSIGHYMMNGFVVFLNFVVIAFEFIITKISFEANSSNVLATQISDFGEAGMWAMSIIFALIHQIISFLTVRNFLFLRQREEDELSKNAKS